MAIIVSKCEEKVRRYLTWLADSASIVNRDEVERLQAEFSQSNDMIEKLRLAEALNQAEYPSVDEVRAGFVECAKEVSETNDLSAAALLRLGVPEGDLRQAGLQVRSLQNQSSVPKRRLAVDEVVAMGPSGQVHRKDTSRPIRRFSNDSSACD